MAGQGAKQQCSLKSWYSIHVHTPTSMSSTLTVPHSQGMEDGCIPKDLLYGQLTTGAMCRGHPQLCFKDVCKHNMKACNIKTESWEAFAENKTLWKQQMSHRLKRGETAV